jgi:amino acid adenylation domain-containing protein
MSLPPDVERRVPMSSAQRRIFLQCQRPGGDRAYHLLHLARLRGPFPLEPVRAFAARLAARHDALRSCFRVERGEFLCEVRSQVEVPLTLLPPAPPGSDPLALAGALAEEHDRPFDLAAPPLFRLLVQPLGPEDRILLFNCHHLVFDGYSGALLARDISDALGGRALRPIARSAADFAGWEREFFASAEYARQRDFWLARYARPPERLAFPTDFAPPQGKSFRGASLLRHLETAGLRAFCRERGATLFTVLLAAFACVLHHATGRTKISLGTLVSPREAGGFQDVVGLFANTLPLTLGLDPAMPFAAFLERVRGEVVAAMENAEFPFEHLVAQLPFAEQGERNPLVDVVFNYERSAGDRVAPFGSATLEPLDCYAGVSMFDFAVDLVEYADAVRIRLEYCTDLYSEATMAGLLNALAAVTGQVCADPDVPVGRLGLLTAGDSARIAQWNDTARPAAGGTFLDVWRRRLGEYADNPAVRQAGRERTYAWLDARSERLARALRGRGVAPGDVVAVALAPAPDWPAALLALWRIGAAYLPLDPGLPARRLAFQLADSGAVLVLTQASLRAAFADFPDVATLEELEPAAGGAGAPDVAADPGRAAYVLYTSGSTGEPKGVVVEQRAVQAHIEAVQAVYRLQPDDNVLQFAAPTFDASLEQILATLAAGACLVLPDARLKPPRDMLALLADEAVTVAEFPPAYLRELASVLAEAGGRSLRRLRRLASGGEALDMELARELLRLLPAGARLINFYGPTEAAMAATSFLAPADLAPYAALRSLPIGRPLANTRAHVVGPGGALLPVGLSGELCIAGERLARGYLNRPELTAGRFVRLETPAGPERVYRTGDRARWLPDGELEYLGRLDRQVQVRGHRVEPGEVEQALLAHAQVRDAVVLPEEDGGLLAFTSGPAGPRELAAWLRERLPDYMLPAGFVVLPAIPRSAAGKPDQDALRAARPQAAKDAAEPGGPGREPPLDALEWELWGVWRDVLKTADFGRTDVFQQLGGNSLGLLRVMTEVRNRHGVDLPLDLLLGSPSISALAEFIRGAGGGGAACRVVAFGRKERAAGPAIALLPALGGLLLDVADLGAALAARADGQGVFGLALPLADDERLADAGGDLVEALAAEALAALDAAAGRDALAGGVLVGYCFGALVALRMARVLEAGGVAPRRLVLLDAMAPGCNEAEAALDRRGLLNMAMGMLLGGDAAAWTPAAADEDEAQACIRALALLQRARRAPLALTVEDLRRDLGALARRAAAQAVRAPAAPIRADILQVRAQDEPGDRDAEAWRWDWSAWTTGNFAVQWTPGDHFTMIKGGNAAALAALVARPDAAGR